MSKKKQMIIEKQERERIQNNWRNWALIRDLTEVEFKPKKKADAKLRPFGDVISDLEVVIQEMVSQHDLQFGDILNIVHGYLCVHNPEAQEEYTDGSGSPVFYYGPNKQGVK